MAHKSKEEIIHTQTDKNLTGKISLIERLIEIFPNLKRKYLE